MTRPVKPPKVPDSYVASPLLPTALAEAHRAVPRYGQRLSLGLLVLAALNALGGVTGLGGVTWGWQWLGQLQAHWPRDVNAEWKPYLTYSGPLAAGLGLLTLLAISYNIWCILVARKTVQAIQNQVMTPGPAHAEQTVHGVRTLLPWLTLGQWLPVISFVFLTLPSLGVTAAFLSSDGSHKAADLSSNILSYGVSSLIQTIPYIVIPWLLLAAVKRWLQAVATRTARPDFPVRPFAGSLNNWLVFLMVVFGLYAVCAVFGGLILTLLSGVISQQSDVKAAGFSWLGTLSAVLGVYIFVIGLLYTYETVMVMWLRAFANASSLVLDSERSAGTGESVQQVPEDW